MDDHTKSVLILWGPLQEIINGRPNSSDLSNCKISRCLKNNTLSILRYFPSQLKPRDIQLEILKDVEEKINSGYKKIVISAPTGVGKSAIGIAISYYLGDSFMVTASKNLQDQYIEDYPDLHPVKGKSNFPCLKLMEEKGTDDPILAAKTMELTCEKGKCEEGKNWLQKEVLQV